MSDTEQISQINKEKKNPSWQFKAKGSSESSKILGSWEKNLSGSQMEGSNLGATDDSRIVYLLNCLSFACDNSWDIVSRYPAAVCS